MREAICILDSDTVTSAPAQEQDGAAFETHATVAADSPGGHEAAAQAIGVDR